MAGFSYRPRRRRGPRRQKPLGHASRIAEARLAPAAILNAMRVDRRRAATAVDRPSPGRSVRAAERAVHTDHAVAAGGICGGAVGRLLDCGGAGTRPRPLPDAVRRHHLGVRPPIPADAREAITLERVRVRSATETLRHGARSWFVQKNLRVARRPHVPEAAHEVRCTRYCERNNDYSRGLGRSANCVKSAAPRAALLRDLRLAWHPVSVIRVGPTNDGTG